MNRSDFKICLISPSHPCSNPRMVKEADILSSAGFPVHVVCSRYMPALDPFDRAIFANAAWSYSVVDHTSRGRRLVHGFSRRVARSSDAIAKKLPLLAHHPPARDLLPAATALRARHYVGHVLAGLPIAVAAAKTRRVSAGFDAEDFHRGEIADSPENRRDLIARRQLERLIVRCVDRTAASPGIARAYRDVLGIPFEVILNVFPLAMAPALPLNHSSDDKPVRFYWFSQTIGEGRGLENFLETIRLIEKPWLLHLRGHGAERIREKFDQLAPGRIVWEPPAAAAEMARLAAPFDIGLSLERSDPVNRDICLTNKIFTYLLAGLPVILSPTTAQIELAEKLGEAAIVVDFSDPTQAASKLSDLAFTPEKLARAKAASWHLGQTIYNWDHEGGKRILAMDRLAQSQT